MKLYPIADRLTLEERVKLAGKTGLSFPEMELLHHNTRATLTGEKRAPKAGEWYLSGAIPAGYRAPNDLTIVYNICRLVLIEEKTVTTQTIVKTI